MFEVLGRFNEIIVSSNTLHIADRLNRVDECTKGSDIVVDRFIVDKGHKMVQRYTKYTLIQRLRFTI